MCLIMIICAKNLLKSSTYLELGLAEGHFLNKLTFFEFENVILYAKEILLQSSWRPMQGVTCFIWLYRYF